jgi:hypothetical protein
MRTKWIVTALIMLFLQMFCFRGEAFARKDRFDMRGIKVYRVDTGEMVAEDDNAELGRTAISRPTRDRIRYRLEITFRAKREIESGETNIILRNASGEARYPDSNSNVYSSHWWRDIPSIRKGREFKFTEYLDVLETAGEGDRFSLKFDRQKIRFSEEGRETDEDDEVEFKIRGEVTPVPDESELPTRIVLQELPDITYDDDVSVYTSHCSRCSGMRIYQRKDNGPYTQLTGEYYDKCHPGDSFKARNLETGSCYRWYVVPYNDIGDGPRSNMVRTCIESHPEDLVPELSATYYSFYDGDTTMVYWDAIPNASCYEIEKCRDDRLYGIVETDELSFEETLDGKYSRYSFRVRAHYPNGQDSDWSNTLTISNENSPPVADAGDDQTVGENEAAVLNGTDSSDPNGDVIVYRWTTDDGNFISDEPYVKVAFSKGVWIVTLKVIDSRGASDTDTVTITVTESPNYPPIADAGDDKTARVGEDITLTGEATDPDGDAMLYQWRLGDEVLSESRSVTLRFNKVKEYVLTFVATDIHGSSGSDETVLTVYRPNSPPVANAGPDQTINTGDTIILDGTGSSDPDGDSLSYKWMLGSEVLKEQASFNAEFPYAGIYDFVLEVSDGRGGTDTDTVTITVNELPPSENPPPGPGNGDSGSNPGEGDVNPPADEPEVPPTPCRCRILGVAWDRPEANDGDEVNMIISDNGCCEGKAATIEIYEKDFSILPDEYNSTIYYTISESHSGPAWHAAHMKDFFWGEPECYFKLTLGDQILTSGLLSVHPAQPFPPEEIERLLADFPLELEVDECDPYAVNQGTMNYKCIENRIAAGQYPDNGIDGEKFSEYTLDAFFVVWIGSAAWCLVGNGIAYIGAVLCADTGVACAGAPFYYWSWVSGSSACAAFGAETAAAFTTARRGAAQSFRSQSLRSVLDRVKGMRQSQGARIVSESVSEEGAILRTAKDGIMTEDIIALKEVATEQGLANIPRRYVYSDFIGRYSQRLLDYSRNRIQIYIHNLNPSEKEFVGSIFESEFFPTLVDDYVYTASYGRYAPQGLINVMEFLPGEATSAVSGRHMSLASRYSTIIEYSPLTLSPAEALAGNFRHEATHIIMNEFISDGGAVIKQTGPMEVNLVEDFFADYYTTRILAGAELETQRAYLQGYMRSFWRRCDVYSMINDYKAGQKHNLQALYNMVKISGDHELLASIEETISYEIDINLFREESQVMISEAEAVFSELPGSSLSRRLMDILAKYGIIESSGAAIQSVSAQIKANVGGMVYIQLTNDGETSLFIPPDSLPSDRVITVSEVNTNIETEFIDDALIGIPVRYEPEETRFTKSATLEIRVPEGLVEDPERLVILVHDEESGRWLEIEHCNVVHDEDSGAYQVSCPINHFSVYSVGTFSPEPDIPAAGLPDGEGGCFIGTVTQ